jgi:uncharacterized protein
MYVFSRLVRFLCVALVASCLGFGTSAAGQDSASGPSFNCEKARIQAEKIICTTPELAALDRQLANIYNNIHYQTRAEGATLYADEMHWLREVRNACKNVPCLKEAYEKRIQQLSDQSQKTASPAAYEETRPFPVTDALWAEARSYIGKSCTADLSTGLNGFEKVKGFPPVTARDAVVQVRAKQGTRFAFLLITKGEKPDSCRIADVVTLPSSTVANTFLSCSISDLPSYGIGMRLSGQSKVVAYWEINAQEGKLLRQPLGVLGAEKSIRCNFPETGE